MTRNERFNSVFAEWKRQIPNHSDPECEECGRSLVGKDVVEGEWGWFCSMRCSNIRDERMASIPSDDWFRKQERRQMGILG